MRTWYFNCSVFKEKMKTNNELSLTFKHQSFNQILFPYFILFIKLLHPESFHPFQLIQSVFTHFPPLKYPCLLPICSFIKEFRNFSVFTINQALPLTQYTYELHFAIYFYSNFPSNLIPFCPISEPICFPVNCNILVNEWINAAIS